MSVETIDASMDAVRDRSLEAERVTIRNAGEIDEAFRAMQRRGPSAALMPATLRVLENRAIAELAIRRGVALASSQSEWVEAGALLSFALAHRDEDDSRLAIVAQILRGANPANLPFRLPDWSELVVNEATARALRLSIPDEVRLRATRIVS